jgi:hypothetical protein
LKRKKYPVPGTAEKSFFDQKLQLNPDTIRIHIRIQNSDKNTKNRIGLGITTLWILFCAATGLVKADAAWMEELVGWNPDTLRKQNPTGTHNKLIIIRHIYCG